MERIFLNSVFRRGFSSNVVVGDGEIQMRNTRKIESSQTNLVHNNTLCTLKDGLTLAKHFIENNSSINTLTIQLTNSVITSWIIGGKAPEKYTDNFLSVMKLLDSIPVTYNIVLDSTNVAERYACSKYVKKFKLQPIEIVEDDDNSDLTLVAVDKNEKLSGVASILGGR